MLQAGIVEGTLCMYQAAITKSPNHCNKAVCYESVGKFPNAMSTVRGKNFVTGMMQSSKK
eukprot:9160802-Ditylum_brightwellii.AAC.1